MTDLSAFGFAAAVLLLSGVLRRKPLLSLAGVAAMAAVGFLAALWGQLADFGIVIVLAIGGTVELAVLVRGLMASHRPKQKVAPAFFVT